MAYKSQPTITRPANQTPYTAGDVVGGAFQFPGLPTAAGVFITYADLQIQASAIAAGMTSYRYHLYDRQPASAIADNAAWDLAAADRTAYLGYLDVGSPADFGSTLYCKTGQINEHYITGDGIWCYMVTNGAYTPAANSEVYLPSLRAIAGD